MAVIPGLHILGKKNNKSIPLEIPQKDTGHLLEGQGDLLTYTIITEYILYTLQLVINLETIALLYDHYCLYIVHVWP
ncbi:hypothetical protein SK128_025484 [Halocaridina rubra]|uniref:Uncharacterized protein n=1 Tax=Halocaridina rubra TaxID=373956 RepID=A0AAN8ZQJ5_HALRR